MYILQYTNMMKNKPLVQSLITCSLPRLRMPLFFILNADTFDAYFADKLDAKAGATSIQEIGGNSFNSIPLINLVYLCGTHDNSYNSDKSTSCKLADVVTDATEESQKTKTSLLKSHLQKCIRKSNSPLSVSTAIELFKLNPLELFRRLPIIMIEDCMIMKEFTTLVWIMLYYSLPDHKQSKINISQDVVLKWTCDTVSKMANCPIVDIVGKDTIGISDRDIIRNVKDNVNSSVLWALKIRKYYGGTQGDMEMIQSAINIWYNHMSDINLVSERKMLYSEHPVAMPMRQEDIDLMTSVKHWDLSAVDFHCTNIIDHLVADVANISNTNITKDMWKKILWACSSSVTNKKQIGLSRPVCKDEESVSFHTIYEQYHSIIKKHQLRILKHVLNVQN